jgi:hypothetical protein
MTQRRVGGGEKIWEKQKGGSIEEDKDEAMGGG